MPVKHSFTKLLKDFGDNVSTFLNTGTLNESERNSQNATTGCEALINPSEKCVTSQTQTILDESRTTDVTIKSTNCTTPHSIVSTSRCSGEVLQNFFSNSATSSNSLATVSLTKLNSPILPSEIDHIGLQCSDLSKKTEISATTPTKSINSFTCHEDAQQHFDVNPFNQVNDYSRKSSVQSNYFQLAENPVLTYPVSSLTFSSNSNRHASCSKNNNCQIVWSSPSGITSISYSPSVNLNSISNHIVKSSDEDLGLFPQNISRSNAGGDYIGSERKFTQPNISPQDIYTNANSSPSPTFIFKSDNNFHKFNRSCTRLWCVFCQKSDHSSHFCQRFRSKEEYWAKVLSERRCKNCLRLFHKSDNCYNYSFCRNFGCRRRDKHSPVLCNYNYFYSNTFPTTFMPLNAHLQKRRKPPPLMSLNLSYNRQENISHSPSPKKALDVSTQTCFSHSFQNKSVSFKSQYSQTDFISISYLNPEISHSINDQIVATEKSHSINNQIVNSTTKKTKSKKCETLDSILASSDLQQLFEFDNEKSVQFKEKCQVKSKNVKLPNFEAISFSEMINIKDPIVENTKVKYWQNTKNPDYFRALQYLRHQAAKEDKSNIDIDVINCAIKCIQKFMDRSSPNTACLYRVQLNEVIRKLPVSKI